MAVFEHEIYLHLEAVKKAEKGTIIFFV